jgi:hypothetical protein
MMGICTTDRLHVHKEVDNMTRLGEGSQPIMTAFQILALAQRLCFLPACVYVCM